MEILWLTEIQTYIFLLHKATTTSTTYAYNDSSNMAANDDSDALPRSRLTHNYEYGPLGPWTMDNFDTHQTICVWIMKFMGALSMLASYFIIRDIVIRYYRRERIRLTSKVIFELSIGDFFGSFFSAVLGTWMAPKESGAYMAVGTTVSCTAQGFLQAFFYGIAITMNAVLAIIYCHLVIVDREDGTRTKRSVRLILGAPLLIPLVLSVMPLTYDGYNYTDASVCGVGEFPLGCLAIEDEEIFPDGCTRGMMAVAMKYIQLTFILMINLVIVLSVVIMIFHASLKDRRMNKSSTTTSAAATNSATNATSNNDGYTIYRAGRKHKHNNLTSKYVWQGIWYVASFQIAWFPWYVWQWIRITTETEYTENEYIYNHPYESVSLLYILSITHPSQGFLNSLVYFRPSYRNYRHRDETEFRLASICRVLNVPVPRVLLVEWWKSVCVKCCWKESEESDVNGNEDAKLGDDPRDARMLQI